MYINYIAKLIYNCRFDRYNMLSTEPGIRETSVSTLYKRPRLLPGSAGVSNHFSGRFRHSFVLEISNKYLFEFQEYIYICSTNRIMTLK